MTFRIRLFERFDLCRVRLKSVSGYLWWLRTTADIGLKTSTDPCQPPDRKKTPPEIDRGESVIAHKYGSEPEGAPPRCLSSLALAYECLGEGVLHLCR